MVKKIYVSKDVTLSDGTRVQERREYDSKRAGIILPNTRPHSRTTISSDGKTKTVEEYDPDSWWYPYK